MKEVITKLELQLLDDLAVAAGDLENALCRIEGQPAAADGVRHAQGRMMHAIETLLLVEEWDRQKREIIAAYICAGGREQLETFVDRLGIHIELRGRGGNN